MDRTVDVPDRPEAVALADVLAIAAHRAGPTIDGARIAILAASLRERLFRMDQVPTDARESIELFASAVTAAGATEEGCDADVRRALLAGDLARDARVTYRELYLAAHRQAALSQRRSNPPAPSGAPPSPSLAPPNDARAPDEIALRRPRVRCLARIDLALAQVAAYRPIGDAMRSMERDGDALAEATARGLVIADPGAAPVASTVAARALVETSGDVVVSPAVESVGKDPAKVTAIEPYGGEDVARVVVRLSAPAVFTVGTLGEGEVGGSPRVFVDIARASARGLPRETDVGGLVKRVRLGAHTGGTRVVLDLASTVSRRVFYLPDPFRIVIDVASHRTALADRAPDAGPRVIRRVALDPGHGGTDSGAVGPTGLREKDVTLDIAHRTAPLLAHELQVETLLTRDNDSFVPLDLRAARANAFHADLFISVHCNASENGAARGVQTFILDEARDPEGVAARVAARENAQRGHEDALDLSALLTHLRQGDLPVRSRHVADLLQRAALGSLATRYPDTRDQGIKTAGFFVLVGADMPAVLFETAFISNSDDESRLATADYRQKLADAITNAVRAYKAGK